MDDTDGEASQAGDIFRAVAGADAAAVLVIVPIEYAVMAAVHLQEALGVGLLGARLVMP